MAEQRKFAGVASRSQLKAAHNLGTVFNSLDPQMKKFRNPDLEVYDSYYEARQYAGLVPWENANGEDSTHIPVRDRQPRIQLNLAKMLSSRVGSKLIGKNGFPKLEIEDDPDTEDYIRAVIQTSRLKAVLAEPVRRMLNTGSCFVKFSIVNGQWKMNHYLAKWCFPKFDEVGGLESIEIKYVYDDEEDRDQRNQPKKKWFKLALTKDKDVLYDNPEFSRGSDPTFKVVKSVQHNLGFVQGEWLKTSDVPNSVDGPAMVADLMGFIDELNYSFSQSSMAIQYNQDPQLILNNMDEDDLEKLFRSSAKGWNLGKDGDAKFLEAGMSGVEAANEFRNNMRLSIQDIARIVLLDPEKIVGHAQSGKAMEVLHGPLVELIEEIRPNLEKSLVSLVLKMAATNMAVSKSGGISPIPIPKGYAPKSLNLIAKWPEIFPMTLEDLQKKVSIANSVATANIISRETAMKWIAKDFGIEDIEEEKAKIAAQPVINPFGGF